MNLYLMVGPAGSGKSTWAKEFANGWLALGQKVKIISRDAIRFSMVQEEEDYFSKEDNVFQEYVNQIQSSLLENDFTIADATHLTKASRRKLFNRLNLQGVFITAVVCCPPLETTIKQNANRIGRAFVPENVIRRMYNQFEAPTYKEKPGYINILTVYYD